MAGGGRSRSRDRDGSGSGRRLASTVGLANLNSGGSGGHGQCSRDGRNSGSGSGVWATPTLVDLNLLRVGSSNCEKSEGEEDQESRSTRERHVG